MYLIPNKGMSSSEVLNRAHLVVSFSSIRLEKCLKMTCVLRPVPLLDGTLEFSMTHESCSHRVKVLPVLNIRPFLRQNVNASSEPQRLSRVHCSLSSFCLLAFTLLIFLLQPIHVSSKQVRVGHLKLDYFFGADHCANLLLSIRRSEETFVVSRLK